MTSTKMAFRFEKERAFGNHFTKPQHSTRACRRTSSTRWTRQESQKLLDKTISRTLLLENLEIPEIPDIAVLATKVNLRTKGKVRGADPER